MTRHSHSIDKGVISSHVISADIKKAIALP